MNWIPSLNNTFENTFGTAKDLARQGIIKTFDSLKYIASTLVTPQEFNDLDISNHRATLDLTKVKGSVDELMEYVEKNTFPIEDRPRGDKDLSSIRYFLEGGLAEPISLLLYEGKLIKLDGVHRAIASYLLGSSILCDIFETTLD
jgi:hypothetical protein